MSMKRKSHHHGHDRPMIRDDHPRSRRDDKCDKRPKLGTTEPEFPKLDQTDPLHARRIQQRRRMVVFGKNTVGYDEYSRQVPRHKRRPKCMRHPCTPDHTLDIPTRRWQGLVQAWRKALHEYDPVDLVPAFTVEATEKSDKPQLKDMSTVQARQLADACERGLLVDVSPTPMIDMAMNTTSAQVTEGESSSFIDSNDESVDELDKWENVKKENDNDFLLEDSDDDLL